MLDNIVPMEFSDRTVISLLTTQENNLPLPEEGTEHDLWEYLCRHISGEHHSGHLPAPLAEALAEVAPSGAITYTIPSEKQHIVTTVIGKFLKQARVALGCTIYTQRVVDTLQTYAVYIENTCRTQSTEGNIVNLTKFRNARNMHMQRNMLFLISFDENIPTIQTIQFGESY